MLEIGPGRIAHPSGGLWLPSHRTLLLADVHLGYGWALRRRGQLGPVGDDRVCRKLRDAVAELAPVHIVFLGDLVHAPNPAPAERAAIESIVAELAASAQVTIVLGNHDRALERDFPSLPAEICRAWTAPGGDLVAVHGDREVPATPHAVIGHLHPALSVVDHAGASHRMPVFVAGPQLTLLPAFSPFAAGCDIRDGIPLPITGARVAVTSGRRVVDLGPLARVVSQA